MLVAVVSVKGSPGVTTFALALASSWPARHWSILVEADPSGGDLAWRFALDSSPGLLSLAAAARRDTDQRLLWQHAQQLPGEVPAVCAPVDAGRSRRALSELLESGPGRVEVFGSAARAPGASVIVDCGRVDEVSPVLPVVQRADTVLLLSDARSDALTHLIDGFPRMRRWNDATRLVLVGPGHSAAEVEREVGAEVVGHLPEDPLGASVLAGERADSRRTRRRWSRSGLGAAAADIARTVAALPSRAGYVAAPPPAHSIEPPRTGPGLSDGSRLQARLEWLRPADDTEEARR